MFSPAIRFPSGRIFKIEKTPSHREIILLFLDKKTLFSYFNLAPKEDVPGCLWLPLARNESWGKKGEMVFVLLPSDNNVTIFRSMLNNYPEYPADAPFYFLSPAGKKGYDGEFQKDQFFCCYTLYKDDWYPVCYTPFQSAVIELEIDEKHTYDFIAFGSESNLAVAVMQGTEIHLSPTYGRLVDWTQLEMANQWMDRKRKDFLSSGVIFHEYYHESLLHTYLSKYGQKSTYTHTEAHFANILFDNRFFSTPLLGVIFDEADHTSNGTIEGSDLVYGTMAKVQILASWRPIPVPGHASTYLEPWRATLAILREVVGDLENLDIPFLRLLRNNREIHYVIDAINKRIINVTPSSSMNHILMAIFELLDYRSLIEEYDMQNKRFDEFFIAEEAETYPINIIQIEGRTYLDTHELFSHIVNDIKKGKSPQKILHQAIHTLFAETTNLLKAYAETYNEKRVALSGHLFVHPHLLQLMVYHLEKAGLVPLLHKRIPTDDSSVALGALLHILAQKEMKSSHEV
ncbi:Kae1-like domain-containing protein [Thermospira aquatica]|uniref:Carbamoyltransferase Kae1-like domain-containing protein n=1 Tax=Thermospira aquatica TaxID=2828656 RepID=A0AAX3BH76_9SPIR|nr:hypothetical protein [Thermospira aquatica]URA10801.1 hypothetical protein KDW03_03070 [Thermospira aquatica]